MKRLRIKTEQRDFRWIWMHANLFHYCSLIIDLSLNKQKAVCFGVISLRRMAPFIWSNQFNFLNYWSWMELDGNGCIFNAWTFSPQYAFSMTDVELSYFEIWEMWNTNRKLTKLHHTNVSAGKQTDVWKESEQKQKQKWNGKMVHDEMSMLMLI